MADVGLVNSQTAALSWPRDSRATLRLTAGPPPWTMKRMSLKRVAVIAPAVGRAIRLGTSRGLCLAPRQSRHRLVSRLQPTTRAAPLRQRRQRRHPLRVHRPVGSQQHRLGGAPQHALGLRADPPRHARAVAHHAQDRCHRASRQLWPERRRRLGLVSTLQPAGRQRARRSLLSTAAAVLQPQSHLHAPSSPIAAAATTWPATSWATPLACATGATRRSATVRRVRPACSPTFRMGLPTCTDGTSRTSTCITQSRRSPWSRQEGRCGRCWVEPSAWCAAAKTPTHPFAAGRRA